MKTRISSLIIPRLQDILFFAIFIAVLGLGQRMLNIDGDLPRHLATGRLIIQTGTIPTVEPFAYPYEGQLYVSHEWLTDVGFYLIDQYLGLTGVIVLSAALLATTFTTIFSFLTRRQDIRVPILILIIWGAAVTSLNWAARPFLISMLLLAIWLTWTDKLSRGEKIPLWAFFVTMAIWSNLHGEFIAGMLVTIAYTAGWTMDFIFRSEKPDVKTGQRLWLSLLLSAMASLINPAGFRPWLTILGFVNNRYLMSHMVESNSPNFQQPQFLVLLGLLIISIILLVIKPKKISTGQAFLLAGFSAMSLMAARNIHLYGVVAPFVLSETVGEIAQSRIFNSAEVILRKIESQLKGILWPLATTIGLGILLLTGKTGMTYSFGPSVFPVNAVTWLETHPQEGRMFNDLDWGGYIEYRLLLEQKVFVDSMADVTGQLTQQYETVLTMSNGWQDIFTKYHIAWIIMPSDSNLIRTLSADPTWTVIYADSTATILRHR